MRGMKGRVSSGGYSNLVTRGKDFQKLMFSKKKGVLISSFSFLPHKLRCSLKKKVLTSITAQNLEKSGQKLGNKEIDSR